MASTPSPDEAIGSERKMIAPMSVDVLHRQTSTLMFA
jgi:hypothetical protein